VVEWQELTGISKYTTLRNEIYRKEYMLGMPACENHYFKQITAIGNQVKVTKIQRPKNIKIEAFCNRLEEFILEKAY